MGKIDNNKNKIWFYKPATDPDVWIPLHIGSVHAGFPSPAEDYIEASIDLNKELIRDAACTFFARADGDCMDGRGIVDKSLLLVDKSVASYDGCVAVCYLDGEFVVRRLRIEKEYIELHSDNPKYEPLRVTGAMDFRVWGLVRYAVNKMS